MKKRKVHPNDNLPGLGMMKECLVCGKDFLVPDSKSWTYRYGFRYLCTYTCYQAYGRDNRVRFNR